LVHELFQRKEKNMSRLRLVLIGLAVVGSLALAGIAFAGEFTGFPKLSPLYPPPPYLMTEVSMVSIVFEADETAIRELLPPGVEPVPEHTVGISMYVCPQGVGLPPFSATYIPVHVEGFDSPTGSKGYWMVYGFYGPDRVTAALREVFGLPVKLGTTRVERQGDRIRAILTRDGAEMIEATIKLKGESLGKISGIGNFPGIKELPSSQGTQTAVSELIVHRLPWHGEYFPAEPVSLTFKVSDKDPLRKLTPKKLLRASYMSSMTFAFGYVDVVEEMK